MLLLREFWWYLKDIDPVADPQTLVSCSARVSTGQVVASSDRELSTGSCRQGVVTNAARPAIFVAAWFSSCRQKVWNLLRGHTGSGLSVLALAVARVSEEGSVEMDPPNNDFTVWASLLLRTDRTGLS